MPDTHPAVGFIGLGQMGNPMAANIAKAGFKPLCFDSAGTEKLTPSGATSASSLAQVAAQTETIFLSLPNGAIVQSVVEQIIASPDRRVSLVIDLSTIGPQAAITAAQTLNDTDIAFVDAPVSGGRAGALAATITLIWAGSKSEFDRHSSIIDAFCGNPFHVGEKPGQGQAIKLLNNFLSATAMAATSEAMLFGLSHGLDMKTILDVVNVSTGQNSASKDKFTQRILTGTYDAGFFTEHLNKDVQLYINEVRQAATPSAIGTTVSGIWQSATDSFEPSTDFTRIYDFIGKQKP